MHQTDTFITPAMMDDDVSSFEYVIRSMLSRVRIAQPVEVMSVTNNGGLQKIGRVSIRPLVGMIDPNGNIVQHQTIYNVPYMRIQGGNNAIILDPKVGDIGIAVFCDRDISTVKETEDQSGPASKRMHDMTDAIYIMSIINSVPTQYIQFNDTGINIVSPVKVKIQAPESEILTTGKTVVNAGGNVEINSNLNIENDCQNFIINSSSTNITATGNISINSGNVANISASSAINLTAPNINANGLFGSSGAGFTGSVTFSNAVTMNNGLLVNGNVDFRDGYVHHDDVRIDKNHVHEVVNIGEDTLGAH